jgi:hypothetical protein
MATYFTNRISWTDYSDMWDALHAARVRTREAMDKLDLIINPNLTREPRVERDPEVEQGEEPEENPEDGPKADAPAAVPGEKESERGQVIKEIPFRKGESDD